MESEGKRGLETNEKVRWENFFNIFSWLVYYEALKRVFVDVPQNKVGLAVLSTQ